MILPIWLSETICMPHTDWTAEVLDQMHNSMLVITRYSYKLSAQKVSRRISKSEYQKVRQNAAVNH